MNDLIEYNQSELEKIFANDFTTPYFFSLATLYFQSNDLDRAEKVCAIGLKTYTDNLDAIYLLAKIYLFNNQINKSEKLLSKSINQNLISDKILKLFIEIRDSLNRSINETKKNVDLLLERQPDDAFGNRWIHDYQINYLKKDLISNNDKATFKINDNIISYTFYNILKKQKYYQQAELVLNMLESSNKISTSVYKKEYSTISKFLHS